MRLDYDFDRMAQYAVEQIDGDFCVVNPEYNKIEYKLKKVREKINRRLAKLYKLEHETSMIIIITQDDYYKRVPSNTVENLKL